MLDLQTFYDEHPINAAEVLSKLAAAGKDIERLVPQDLTEFDQDHYGGTAATDVLARLCQLTGRSRVLDICSGLGGSSRYLADKHGCHVLGLDLHASRTEGAVDLTRRVGLEHLVTHVRGDAMAMEFDEASFDAAISQEALVHIPDKPRVLGHCMRVLKPGGRLAFTDWAAFEGLSEEARGRLKDTIAAASIFSIAEYRAAVEGAGFRIVDVEDLSAPWQEILHRRLEMYRSLKDETVRRFGEERHRFYMDAYEYFVAAVDKGHLGGVRIAAEK